MTASFVVDRTMPVELPKAASAEATPPVAPQHRHLRQGRRLPERRPGAAGGHPGGGGGGPGPAPRGADAKLAGFVSADVAAPYGKFAEAVDQLRLAGVTDIALDTQPASPGDSAAP